MPYTACDTTIVHQTPMPPDHSSPASLSWHTLLTSKRFLLVIVVVYVSLWMIHPKPFVASDPWGYSMFAYDITDGTYIPEQPTNIFAHRLSVIAPVALIYRLGGVNPFTTNVWPLLVALASIVLVWLAAPPGLTRPLAVLLLASSVPQFDQAVSLMPDSIVATLMLAATFVLYHRQKALRHRWWALSMSFAAAFLLVAAFLAKASVYWLLPFWVLIFLRDLSQRRRPLFLRFYLPLLAWIMLLFAGYLAFSQLVWDDPLARFHSLQALSGNHLWSWSRRPPGEYLNRLTTGPIWMLATFYVPVFAFSAAGLLLVRSQRVRFWAVYYVTILLMLWFGSTSLSIYEPIELFPRMALPLLPAMAIMAGLYLANVFLKGNLTLKDRRLITASGLAIGLLCLPLVWQLARGELDATLFLAPLIVTLTLVMLTRPGHVSKGLAGGLVLILLLWPLGDSMRQAYATPQTDREAMAVVKEVLANTPGQVLLYTADQRSAGPLAYYFGYQYPPHLTVRYYGDGLVHNQESFAEVLMYIDETRAAFLAASYGQPNYSTEMKAQAIDPPLFQEGSVLILRTRDVGLPAHSP